jgi:zinc/manganese transport system permease protein
MNADLNILWPALAAGLLVTATHAPLGMQVLARGSVFIDLAVAQIAGLGVVLADWLGFAPHGAGVQVAALLAALAGALVLHWTEKRWPEVQEAIIGVSFIVAANAAILLLAANPSSAELALAALATAALLFAWFGFGRRLGRIGFYLLFACAVTVSVQLVGLYLVFCTLIVPALATRRVGRRKLLAAYGISALGYAGGLGLSLVTDLPPGPLIVCTMTVLATAFLLKARPA